MQGSWSVAMDEKHPSLAVDDVVLVGAPAWWRTVAMDVVEDGGDGWGGGRRRLAAVRRLSCHRRCMNGEMEGRGDLKLWDALL